MIIQSVIEGGKVYEFTKDWTYDKPYLREPNHFKKGHKIKERIDDWFEMYPERLTSMALHPDKIKKLVEQKILIECQ